MVNGAVRTAASTFPRTPPAPPAPVRGRDACSCIVLIRMLVRNALDLGLPVFIACRACGAPSRRLDLSRLPDELDLDEAARTGRFRCRACGGRQATVMPVLARLIQARARLHIRCVACGREELLSALEACAAYGLETPFDELRRRLRCSPDCTVTAGAMLKGRRLEPRAFPT
jgi:hypothetical protein